MALIECGTPVKIGQHSDTNYKVSDKYKCKLRTIKVVQVKFEVSYGDLFDNTPEPAIKYNFDEAKTDYQKKLSSVGMGGDGIKCWVDMSTSGSNSVSNNFKTSPILEKIDMAGDLLGAPMLKALRETVKSGGGSFNNPVPGNTALNKFIEGKHLSLPKIWESTTFDSSVNVQVSLITPYGSQKAIKKFIIEPIAAMFCLTAGSSYDGISYGNPPYVAAFGTGINFMQLASMNISYDTVGEESELNKWKQPMTVPLSFTLTPAIDGYAALVTGDISSVGDAFSPPSLTNSGIAITSPGMIINSLRPSSEPCSLSKPTSFKPLTRSSETKYQSFESIIEPIIEAIKKDPQASAIRNLRDDFSKKLDVGLSNL